MLEKILLNPEFLFCSCYKLYKEKMLTVCESQIEPQLKVKIVKRLGAKRPKA